MIKMHVKQREFNNTLRQWKKRFDGNFSKFLKTLAFQLWKLIVASTPKDSGDAEEGWNAPEQLKKNTWLISNYIPYIGKLEFGGYSGPSKSGKTQPGVAPYTKNYVSKQHPKGMVRISMNNIIKWAQKEIKK